MMNCINSFKEAYETIKLWLSGITFLVIACLAVAQESVTPYGGQEHRGSFIAGEVDEYILGPNHPAIDTILPMPMAVPPNSNWWVNPPKTVIVYNAETGETREYPAQVRSGLLGEMSETGYIGLDQLQDDHEEQYRAFSNMYTVGPAINWPSRGNVKLVMRFEDIWGNDIYFHCSGSMGDAGVVLTAAHCVYNRDPEINRWAEEIWVYPGWDGNGNLLVTSGTVRDHWGWCRGTTYLAGSDYVNSGSFDRDCALIRLTDRSVGMLTGWFGWHWGDACSTIQGRVYSNFSFPAEDCGEPALHNGQDLYYWSGLIDDCPSNQMTIHTNGGCFNAGWGGMSGSAMYFRDGTNRFVHGICSTSDRDSVANYCLLWEQFTIDMITFENNTRTMTLDLEALKFRCSGLSQVCSDTYLADCTVGVINATNANPYSSSYILRVYLSTNNNISSNDTLLGTWSYSVDFAAMHGISFGVPGPLIPADTPTGTYWVGVILDPGSDGNIANNDTDTWDALQIEVSNDDTFEDISGGDDTCFGSQIGLGETQSHMHCDEDWVWFPASRGGVYVIETSNLGGGADTVLELFSNCTEFQEINDNSVGLASRIFWVSPSSGRADVKISEYADTYVPGGSYDVSVTCLCYISTILNQFPVWPINVNIQDLLLDLNDACP